MAAMHKRENAAMILNLWSLYVWQWWCGACGHDWRGWRCRTCGMERH